MLPFVLGVQRANVFVFVFESSGLTWIELRSIGSVIVITGKIGAILLGAALPQCRHARVGKTAAVTSCCTTASMC